MQDAKAKISGRATLDGVCVLIVDDNSDICELFALVLSDDGAFVRRAASAEAALGALELKAVDVLVSDLSMPEMDGFELLARVRARDAWRRIPALAVSAALDLETRARAAEAGFDAVLAKPVTSRELVGAVATLARKDGRR